MPCQNDDNVAFEHEKHVCDKTNFIEMKKKQKKNKSLT